MSTTEEWRDVSGYEGLYQVSSLGRVKSLARAVPHRDGGLAHRVERVLRQDGSQRYLTVSLHRDGDGGKTKRVNILVCEAFHGAKPSDLHEVAHNDGNRRMNASRNLRWATKKENGEDKVLHGTVARGERQHLAKLTVEAVISIRDRYRRTKHTLEQIAYEYGVSKNTISRVVRRDTWRHV